jgi:hypothetical protein
MIMRFLMFTAAIAFTAPLAGPAQAQQADDVKVNQLIVYGSEPCPASTEDQINICARKPEADRFRIPEELRGGANDRPSQSWAERARSIEYVGASGIGSCSTVGPGGGIGCFNQLVRQAREERADTGDVNWNALIEQARQERLGKIDAEAASVERQLADDE